MEFLKKGIQALKKALGGNDKKKIAENLMVLVIIGAILIIAGSVFFEKDDGDMADTSVSGTDVKQKLQEDVAAMNINANDDELERDMKAILSKISGAGNVDVMVTYETSKEIIPAYDIKTVTNDIQEKDSAGGTRNSREDETDKTVAYEDKSGTQKPIVLKEIEPVVKGVVVVADGADNIRVKEDICNAVAALVDIPIHKIQVFAREKQ